MDIVSSFSDLLQVFAVSMTAATHNNLQELIAGWVFAPRRTIMGMLRARGTGRHHSAYHRLFATAKWSIDKTGLAVYDLIRRFLPQAGRQLTEGLGPHDPAFAIADRPGVEHRQAAFGSTRRCPISAD